MSTNEATKIERSSSFTGNSPTFLQAATLIERLHALRSNANALKFEPNGQADKAIQRWRQQTPFDKGSFFEQRLLIDGMSEDEFQQVLATPVKAPSQELTACQRAFNEAFAKFSSHKNKILPLPEKLRENKMAGFLNVIAPLVQSSIDQVRQGVEKLLKNFPDAPIAPERVIEILYANLAPRLLDMLSRTLVLEMNIARMQGLLPGTAPEERFAAFLEQLQQPEFAFKLFEEYPVLARLLTITIDHWVRFSLEFLTHLCADQQELSAAFYANKKIGTLTGLKGSAGDSHRGGRTVMIAKFSSGFQVVYKPRSLAIDAHFQQLLSWINARGDHPPFRILKTIERETYGWVEFVKHKTCKSKAAVKRFYERQGGYLALLYVLQSSDFHLENLIAAGEHPVLIDLETLLLPRVATVNPAKASELAADALFNDSVMRVMLLPHRIWSTEASKGVEFSGMGGAPGQLSPFESPAWQGEATDEMHLVRKRLEMPGSQNRPSLNGKDVDLLDYAESLITGFTSIYNFLIAHRPELLAEDGPLNRFQQDEIRMVLRATQTYAMILSETLHPDALRHGLDRDRIIDRLWLEIEQRPYLAKVFHFERDDMHQGDVPIFLTRPASRHLWNSTGQSLQNFFEETGMAQVRRCLQNLGDADQQKQLWIIRSSLAVLASGDHGHEHVSTGSVEPQTSASKAQLLQAAKAVGDRLEKLAFRSADDAAWVGLSLNNDLAPLGIDLYDGLTGVALFLAYLGEYTKEGRYTELARAALHSINKQIEQDPSAITSIGGFSGWGGLIYAYTQLGVLWNQPQLLDKAESFAAKIIALIEKDKSYDIIAGAAGAIAALLSLHRVKPSPDTLTVAIQCGDHLIHHAQKMAQGFGWHTFGEDDTPMTGFSHGAAGIAWALLQLAHISGEERFRDPALQAIAYERSLFSPDAGNWPDLRDPKIMGREKKESEQDRFPVLWCHGAPGIGLARLQHLSQLDDAPTRAEIDAALQTTLQQGFGSSHCLCHGDLGNLELFVQAAEILNDRRWQEQVERFSASILGSIEQHGWQCGVPMQVETPGLMCGLAGIGYGLLRLAEPERVPSVLLLEAPM